MGNPFEAAGFKDLPSAKPNPFEAAGHKELPSDAAPSGPSTGEALFRGTTQGATLGFGDELAGVLGAPIVQMYKAYLDHHSGVKTTPQALAEMQAKGISVPQAPSALDRLEELPQEYRALRDQERTANDAAQQAHGGAFLAGNLAGGALTVPFVPGSGLASSMGLGAVNALGTSDADLTKGDFRQAAADTALGAGMGGLAHGAAKVIAPVARAIGNAASSAAEPLAYKAAGPMLRDFREVGPEGARAIGRKLLDEGAVSFGDTASDVARKVEPLRQATGQRLGDIRQALDTMGAHVDPEALAQRVESELVGGQPASLRDVATKMQTEANSLRSLSANGQPLNVSQLAEERGGYGSKINWAQRNADPSTKAYRKLYGIISEEENKAAQAAHPDLAQKYQGAKRDYELIKPAEEMAGDMAKRQQANRFLSLGDRVGAGAVGTAMGLAQDHEDPWGAVAGGLGGALAGRLVRMHGASSAASTLNALGRVGRLAASNPAALGKFGTVLANALHRGGHESLASAHFVLSQANPDYQRLMQDLPEDSR